MNSVFIIILHIGDVRVTKSCIHSLEKYEKGYKEIIVVNNDTNIRVSKDFSQKKITVINNKKNLGFAGGVNRGIQYALKKGADVLILLNNDTYFKKPFIKGLLNIFLVQQKVGIVAPAICFKKDEKDIFDIGGYVSMGSGRTWHKEVDSVASEDIQFPEYVTGAAMMVKKEVFEKIGLFDEKFFLYYEDVDFCLRTRNAEFTIAVDPTVTVYHLLSKTIGKVTPFAVYHQTRSLALFGDKYMKSPFQKVYHMLFSLYQTSIITLKHPRSGIAGWKAVLHTKYNIGRI